MNLIGDEVHSPGVIPHHCSADMAGIGLVSTRFVLLLFGTRTLPTLLLPEAIHTLVIDAMSALFEDACELPVTPGVELDAQLSKQRDELVVIRCDRLITKGRSSHAQRLTGAPLGHLTGLLDVSHRVALTRWAQYFPSSASFRMSLSSVRSATSFLSRAFSFSRSRKRLTSFLSMEPYVFFHL